MSLLALLAGAAAVEAQTCTNATLKNNYSFTSSGVTFADSGLPAPLIGEFASQGTATYDGQGKVVLTAVASFNGIPQPIPAVNGTYSVNGDCTFVSKLDNGATFHGVIVNAARELFVQQTNAGTSLIGSAKLIEPKGTLEAGFREAPCQAKNLTGVFGVRASGKIGPPLPGRPEVVPQIRVGTAEFSADGSFVLNSLVNTNGVVESDIQRSTGTYTLDGCRIKVFLNLSVGLPFEGVLADAGREFTLVEAIPGTTMLVTGKVLQ
ncbi:MAG: hypothetical protein U0Q16_03465 [Bryobacteraceae bacterium]